MLEEHPTCEMCGKDQWDPPDVCRQCSGLHGTCVACFRKMRFAGMAEYFGASKTEVFICPTKEVGVALTLMGQTNGS